MTLKSVYSDYFSLVPVTGIEQVNVSGLRAGNDATYNLAGQRVGNSYKGIVIRNGKKFMKK